MFKLNRLLFLSIISLSGLFAQDNAEPSLGENIEINTPRDNQEISTNVVPENFSNIDLSLIEASNPEEIERAFNEVQSNEQVVDPNVDVAPIENTEEDLYNRLGGQGLIGEFVLEAETEKKTNVTNQSEPVNDKAVTEIKTNVTNQSDPVNEKAVTEKKTNVINQPVPEVKPQPVSTVQNEVIPNTSETTNSNIGAKVIEIKKEPELESVPESESVKEIVATPSFYQNTASVNEREVFTDTYSRIGFYVSKIYVKENRIVIEKIPGFKLPGHYQWNLVDEREVYVKNRLFQININRTFYNVEQRTYQVEIHLEEIEK